jgi:hypothetical protein
MGAHDMGAYASDSVRTLVCPLVGLADGLVGRLLCSNTTLADVM